MDKVKKGRCITRAPNPTPSPQKDKNLIPSARGGGRVRVMVLNATFNTISVISWRSVLLVKETGVVIHLPLLFIRIAY
jgi:hypothetical protein